MTDGRFADASPVFTLDGLYLAFLSQRSFDPVYDAHTFDLSFPFGGRPYLVPLAAETPSPFGPMPDGRPLGQDNGEDPAAEAAVTVDPDGLAGRVVALPVEEARYRYLRPVKGGLVWLRAPVAGVLGEGGAGPDDDRPRPALQRFDLRKREVKELAGALDWFRVSGDGTRLVVRDHDELRVMPSARKHDDAGETVTVDLTRARFQADPAALWRHAYGEAGRYLRRDFWTPDMSGVDWDGVLGDYRPLLDRIRGAADFADLLWEVLGELGTSHAYVTAAWERHAELHPGGSARRGHLARRGRPLGGGPGAAGRVVGPAGALAAGRARRRGQSRRRTGRGGRAAGRPAARPLAAAGRHGGQARRADGAAGGTTPPDPPLLSGGPIPPAPPREIPPRPPGGQSPAQVVPPGPRARVVVVPLRSDRRLRYQDWVAGRRRLVRELSDGRLGYLHIPDMMGEGWAHFHRDLRTEMARDGLIFDVRGNSGGHISELVVEKLARRVVGWCLGRWLQPESYPQEARRGPLVTVADEFAGSDGDIVTAAVKLLGLGPVVGTRTWGGVIGIEGHQGLVDGSAVTVPRYAFYFDEYGWGVENYGVDPDMEVLITPDDAAAGRDTQLETAVQLALEALDKQPPPAPPQVATGPARPAARCRPVPGPQFPRSPLLPRLRCLMIADPAQLRTRRIWALTVMFCVAVVVLTADAISKAQVLARLPGHPPVRLLRRADHAGPHLQRRRRLRRGHVLHRGHRPDRVRRDRLHHPHRPAAAQPGLDDRARAAARRGDGQPRRPAVPGAGPAPRPGRGLDQPAALPVDVQPGRRVDHLRGGADRRAGAARRPDRRHLPGACRRPDRRRPPRRMPPTGSTAHPRSAPPTVMAPHGWRTAASAPRDPEAGRPLLGRVYARLSSDEAALTGKPASG